MKSLIRTASATAIAVSMLAAPSTVYAQSEDVIVVRGTLVPDEKKSTSEISSLVDAESFARAGDSDVASALLRVTGISITDGKFPVARGLNERYSSATLNGVPLPSPEPLRRAVPLDIVPTSILSESLVQKTFSPEYSGEFGGAAIDLRTLSIPSENFLKVSISGEIDTESTFRNGLFYEGSDTDVLGWDDGLRDIPSLVLEEARTRPNANVLSAEARSSFEQFDTLIITEGDETPMNASGSLAFGRVLFDGDEVTIGTINSIGYSNSFTDREGFEERTFDVGLVDNFERSTEFNETRQDVELNVFSSTGIEFGNGDHSISLTGLLLRNSLKRARISAVVNEAEGDSEPFRTEGTEWIERELWQGQLVGDHLFPNLNDLEFAWAASYGEATRDAPYERSARYDLADVYFGPVATSLTPIALTRPTETFVFDPDDSDTFINFSELKDENAFFRGDFTLPAEIGNFPVTFKAGGAYTDSSRETLVIKVLFEGDELLTDLADLTILRPDLLFSEDILRDTDAFNVRFNSGTNLEPDSTEASLEVTAGYLSGDIELNPYLRASLGFRYEDSTQITSTFNQATGVASGGTETLEESYWLPAGTITWNPVGDLQLRIGASQTITRPQFRELAGTVFTDPDLNTVLRGNPFLENSEILNIDARAEYYFSRGQFATLGVFYKDIDNAIERFNVGDEARTLTFVNSGTAEVWGVEAEFEKRFDLYDKFDGAFDGKELVLITNYTYTDSEVTPFERITFSSGAGNESSSTNVLIPGHKLQGQSDHLFNLQLGVEDVDTGSKATLVFNYASERTLALGNIIGGTPADEVIEQPPVSMDLVVKQNLDEANPFTKGMELGISVKNILGDDFYTYRDVNLGGGVTEERPFLEYDRGTKFSISLSKEF